MDVSAKITGIKYTPFLCRRLSTESIYNLEEALLKRGTFILNIDEKCQIALSRWTSAKRSRTYPHSRVYDSLQFPGKKVTVIPLYKDEGKKGDRDYLQWDTISLMSLLGIHTIISYYVDAVPSTRKVKKITKQTFDVEHVKSEMYALLSYQSDALHWNLSQINKVGALGQRALDSYQKISKKLGIEMHSKEAAQKRIDVLLKGKQNFMNLSRSLAKEAQSRESVTIQPKEKLSGQKATITIRNYLGGYYYFTCDEVKIEQNKVFLVEGKNSNKSLLPSPGDIIEGLVKMILFANLHEVTIGSKEYLPVAVLKLTGNKRFSTELLKRSQRERLQLLKKEAQENNFQVFIDDMNLEDIHDLQSQER